MDTLHLIRLFDQEPRYVGPKKVRQRQFAFDVIAHLEGRLYEETAVIETLTDLNKETVRNVLLALKRVGLIERRGNHRWARLWCLEGEEYRLQYRKTYGVEATCVQLKKFKADWESEE